MLFTRISITALLLFVATVSSAPLHESVEGVTTHADHAGEGLPPALSHGSKQHAFAGPAAAQGVPGALAPAHSASHVHVHATPDSSLEGPADPPTQHYERRQVNAIVQDRLRAAARAHQAAAAAHHTAAGNHYDLASHHLATGNLAAMSAARRRAQRHDGKVTRHRTIAAQHRSDARALGHLAPLHPLDAAHLRRFANGSAHYARVSANEARN
ncbi:hypothetical protein HYPSUDRAFT_57833 [Hypholoma sublateritium FD-334 SS-4]|uniref:SCP domain-containing protein n=1 Tax=Hypholoma sublateritium (strain FD-334 SS-4) TaxID=945553 RepID=A0A0D2NDV3_HYPSF|nr:hypothetical protein HYPSUDRAFT_57833 [Hypholoma sublateritium FD-334 SS-4]